MARNICCSWEKYFKEVWMNSNSLSIYRFLVEKNNYFTLQYLSHESKVIYTGHRYHSLLNQLRTVLYSGSYTILWHSPSLSTKDWLHLVWTYLHSQSRSYQKLESKTCWEMKQKNSKDPSYNLKIVSTLTF